MEIVGEGELGSWFSARNSGIDLRVMEPSASRAVSLSKPLKAWASLLRLPEARTRKN